MKLLLILLLIISCSTTTKKRGSIPLYISQDKEQFFVNLIFDKIPNHQFLIDDIEVNHEKIIYEHHNFGHLIKIPVNDKNTDFKVKTTLTTFLHKKMILNRSPESILMVSNYSKSMMKTIELENPHVIIAFSPPKTKFFKDDDFLKNPIFSMNVLRPVHFVGSNIIKTPFSFKHFEIRDIDQNPQLKKPSILSHYLPFNGLDKNGNSEFSIENLKKIEIPTIFVSSFTTNLIQQIPRSKVGLPSYEFSVKNNFLALPDSSPSPWEVISDQKPEYIVLNMKFEGDFWNILINAKDENQEVVFSRDLTSYKTKPQELKPRRRGRR